MKNFLTKHTRTLTHTHTHTCGKNPNPDLGKQANHIHRSSQTHFGGKKKTNPERAIPAHWGLLQWGLALTTDGRTINTFLIHVSKGNKERGDLEGGQCSSLRGPVTELSEISPSGYGESGTKEQLGEGVEET